ncbi:phosphatase PAP2 family protein [Prevotella sp. OH937_COT-195]|uniref:phosphatase PAP2 family protein n=1 Tax=Prevotella sp. OH937_COT-195 TaxID=2491051 RepID=UPI000F64B812|nr:phosphatase PAP2 family protein [Prevotella sp. OH937_COT-195]RRD02521.1 phosphatase PAP2 family protein [Prevotella sp. OH937_COT-195]
MKNILFVCVLLFSALPCTAQESAAKNVTLPVEQNGKRFHGDGIDDVLQYMPFATVLTLKALGVESKSEWGRLAVNTAVSYVVTAGICYTMKHTIHTMRPDRTDNRSFPSGHTAIAFAGATLMAKEYGQVSPWITVGGYTVATITAIDRVRRNRHRWGDVVTGAAIGIAAAEAGYYIGKLILPDRDRYVLSVSPMGMNLVVKL